MARIGLLTASASRLGGGVFEAVVAHCDLLRACGHEPAVFALADAESEADRPRFGETPVQVLPVSGPRAVGYAPGLVGALRAAELDLLHLHGIWMYPSHAGAAWQAADGRPYLISPHGMLDPWIVGRGRLKKAVAKIGYERRSWRRATAFHALTEREAADIAAATGRARACHVVPNAIRSAPAGAAAAAGRRRPAHVAYLGRIHPKKNIDALIDGWRIAADVLRPLGARLDIAGWGEADHVAALEAKLAAEALPDVRFLGPVYGDAKAALLGEARFLALPSHSEGLPMVVLEGWAAGAPALMSTECNLPEGFAAGAALDSGFTPETVAAALRAGFALPEARWQAMSAAARALVTTRFAPEVVARRWADVYAALLAPARQAAA